MERFSRMLQAAQGMGMSNAPQGVRDHSMSTLLLWRCCLFRFMETTYLTQGMNRILPTLLITPRPCIYPLWLFLRCYGMAVRVYPWK